MSLYKTSRCRFFTPQGKPMKPYCNKGDHCRYLHPNDAKWASVDKYKAFGAGASATFSAPKPRVRTKTSDSSTPMPSARHSSPLVSQSDLFRLNTDDDFPDVRTTRSSYGYGAEDSAERTRQPKRFERSLERSDSRNGKRPERRFDSGSSSHSKPSTALLGPRSFSSNEVKRNKDTKWFKTQSMGQDQGFTTITSGVREVSVPGTLGTSRDVGISLEERKPAEKVVEIFKNLANISNQAVQDTAAFDQEEKKLKNYTELSSALSKISVSATKAVAPTLAGVIANRAKCKERVENDFITLGYLWEDIFDMFVEGVVGAIDGGLQDALMMLKKEGETAVDKIVASRAVSLKRKVAISESLSSQGKGNRSFLKGTTSTSSRGFDDDRGDSESQSRKRRRRIASSSIESHQGEEEVVLKIEDVDMSVMAMLQDMKMKMERQAQTLDMLTRENNQLKASLDNTPNNKFVVQSGSSPPHRNLSSFSSTSNHDHEQNDCNQSFHDTDADGSLGAVEDILIDYQLSESPADFQSNWHSSTPH